MNILYVSSLCSPIMFDKLFATAKSKPGIAIQKFHRLLVEGLNENGAEVKCLSALSVNRSSHRKIIWSEKSEDVGGVTYQYVSFLNLPVLRQLCLVVITFIQALYWGVKNRGSNTVLICDLLNVSVSNAALCAAYLLGIKTVALVTDMPIRFGEIETKQTVASKIMSSIVSFTVNSYDRYLLLTEQMNELINLKKCPYMVMEGLVDHNMKYMTSLKKDSPRTIIYAGGIFEKYGVRTLIEAFMAIDDPSLQLSIYGDGEMIDMISEFNQQDPRVIYYGMVPNNQIVEAQLKATLLVNPRFSNEEYTKYSFPSKNMEYMVSGTPLLTTKLPGMPDEYLPFIYLFEEESVEGYCAKMKEVLNLGSNELTQKGKAAKEFVLSQKNNVIQAKRVLDFCCDK